MNKSTKVATAIGVAGVVLMGTGCSINTNSDEIGLIYDAGVFSSTTFEECVQPGNREYHGPGDKEYTYPAGQRSYAFGEAESDDTGTLSMVSSDNLTMQVAGIMTFQLNTNCDSLQDFHEKIGLKYNAYDSSGWNDMLAHYLLQPLDRAVDAAAKEYEWQDMFNNAEVKEEWEDRVGELTAQYINEMGGGDYFCSPTADLSEECGNPKLTLQQPQIPSDTAQALENVINAQENAVAQEEINRALELEAEGLDPLIEQFDGNMDALVLYLALQSGDVAMVPGVGLSVAPNQD